MQNNKANALDLSQSHIGSTNKQRGEREVFSRAECMCSVGKPREPSRVGHASIYKPLRNIDVGPLLMVVFGGSPEIPVTTENTPPLEKGLSKYNGRDLI
jgi:hypothetical protein